MTWPRLRYEQFPYFVTERVNHGPGRVRLCVCTLLPQTVESNYAKWQNASLAKDYENVTGFEPGLVPILTT